MRALIFDLDGTLADSLPDIATAMNDALRASGRPEHPLLAYRHFVGEGAEVLVARAAVGAGPDELATLLEAYRASYAARDHALSRPYPGITELLERLGQARVPLAVLSNKRHEFSVGLVEKLFPGVRFAAVLGERPGVPRKPDPLAALELALHLGASPAAVGFVGDTAIDVATALAAGMTPVGAAWGFRDEAELRQAGARFVARQPAELGQVLVQAGLGALQP